MQKVVYACILQNVVLKVAKLYLFHKAVHKETDFSDLDKNNCVYFIVRQTRSQNMFIIRAIQ